MEGADSQAGAAVPWRFRVTSVLRATGPSVPFNVLENSLTPRSVALHLPMSSPGPTETLLRDSVF